MGIVTREWDEIEIEIQKTIPEDLCTVLLSSRGQLAKLESLQ